MIRECNMSTRASEDDLMHWKYKYKKKDKNGRWRYYYDVGRNDMYGPTGSKLQGYTKLQDWLGYDERKVKKGKTLVDKAKNFINKNWSMVTFYD